MVARTLAVLVASLSLAACQDEGAPPVAFGCTEDPATIVKALDAAPDAVTLDQGGTTIASCVRDADNTADLQNVGVALSSAAEDLEAPTLEGDADAGLKLGYLVGAARKGAKTNLGLASGLVRRLEGSVGFDVEPDVETAIERGLRAGAERG